jgi:protein TonB
MLRFVTISLAIHMLAAGAFYYAQPQQGAAPRPGTLSVSLLTFSEPAPENPRVTATETVQSGDSRPATARPASPHTEPAPPTDTTRPVVHERKLMGTTPSHEAANHINTGPEMASVSKADMLDSLRSAVYGALHANFSYPRRARLRGWEGTVVIALRILPDGKLANIRVADSSGISTLDRAAVDSLSKVRVPQVVAWLHGQGLNMTIPVEYRLTGG